MLLFRRPLIHAFFATLFIFSTGHAFSTATLRPPQKQFTGTWQGEHTLPFDPKPLSVRFGIEQTEDGSWRGGFESDALGTELLSGSTGESGLELQCDMGGGPSSLRLTLDGTDQIDPVLLYDGVPFELEMRRTTARLSLLGMERRVEW
jgi:hypothetical protein